MSTSRARSLSRTRLALTCAVSALAVSLVAGCGSSGSSTSSSGSSSMSSGMPAESSSGAVVIHIASFAFTTPASVSPGAKVTVMNMDGVKHTVTADIGNAFDTTVDGGSTSTFTAPTKPGSYAFHCNFHSNMHGTLVVK